MSLFKLIVLMPSTAENELMEVPRPVVVATPDRIWRTRTHVHDQPEMTRNPTGLRETPLVHMNLLYFVLLNYHYLLVLISQLFKN